MRSIRWTFRLIFMSILPIAIILLLLSMIALVGYTLGSDALRAYVPISILITMTLAPVGMGLALFKPNYQVEKGELSSYKEFAQLLREKSPMMGKLARAFTLILYGLLLPVLHGVYMFRAFMLAIYTKYYNIVFRRILCLTSLGLLILAVRNIREFYELEAAHRMIAGSLAELLFVIALCLIYWVASRKQSQPSTE